MEGEGTNRGHVVKRILKEENLPPDLLDRATNIPASEEGDLFEWVMELREILDEEGENVVGNVLSDGVLVSVAGSETISRATATLTDAVRKTLQEEMSDETDLKNQSIFVLALDVQNRVHNRVS